MTQAERQALCRHRKAHNLVQIIAWVPAAVENEAREAVRDVIDNHQRPETPVPAWAKPLGPSIIQGNMRKVMDAQNKAAKLRLRKNHDA